MIKIEKILNKHIYFIDKNGASRINRVVKVYGNTITTQDAVGHKERIRPDLNKIFGIVTGTKNNRAVCDDIQFKQIRKGKRIKTKAALKEINAMKVKPLKTKRPRRGRPRKVKE